MKFNRRNYFLALLVFSAILTLPSCVTSTTTVTSPDGTVTVTKTSGPDAASVNAAGGVIGIVGKIIVEK